jgi:membrane fusion protein, multidrug efflux system
MNQQVDPAAVPAPAAKRPRWPMLVLLGVVLIAAGVYGWHWLQDYLAYVTTDNATIQGDVISISSRVAGTVTSLEFQDNQKVDAGQVLIKLDPVDYELAADQARATLELAQRQSATAETGVGYASAQSGAAQTQAQGGLDYAQAGVTSAQAAVDVAADNLAVSQAKLAQAQAQAELADRELGRARKLADSGVAPRQRLDQAETAATVAQAAVESARQDVAVQQDKLAQAQEDVTKAQAQVRQSHGSVASAQATKQQTEVQRKQYEAALAQIGVAQVAADTAAQQLSYTTIAAPVAGWLGKRSVQAGQRVTTGQPLIALVPDTLWVVANFKETQMSQVKPGLPVEVRVDTYPGRVFQGHVDSISPASGAMFALLPPENASGNFTKVVQRIPVKIVFDADTLGEYKDLLRPGMSVLAKVKIH